MVSPHPEPGGRSQWAGGAGRSPRILPPRAQVIGRERQGDRQFRLFSRHTSAAKICSHARCFHRNSTPKQPAKWAVPRGESPHRPPPLPTRQGLPGWQSSAVPLPALAATATHRKARSNCSGGTGCDAGSAQKPTDLSDATLCTCARFAKACWLSAAAFFQRFLVSYIFFLVLSAWLHPFVTSQRSPTRESCSPKTPKPSLDRLSRL